MRALMLSINAPMKKWHCYSAIFGPYSNSKTIHTQFSPLPSFWKIKPLMFEWLFQGNRNDTIKNDGIVQSNKYCFPFISDGY